MPAENTWYGEGVRFECHRCGQCCKGETGTRSAVWVSVGEIEQLARGFDRTPDEFGRMYLRTINGRYALVDKPGGDCIFWDEEKGCTVYADRPTQCRTFPFWPAHLESRAKWDEVGRRCGGIGHGRLFTKDDIEELCD